MTQSNRFKHESFEDNETISQYFSAMKDGFKSGALVFTSEDRQLALHPNGLINLEIEARRKGDEIKLSLKFKWTEETENENDKSAPLSIQPAEKG